jgi:hypothetical protein
LVKSATTSVGLYAGSGADSFIQYKDGGALSFLTGPANLGTSAERMRIDAAGNVGIGVVPSSTRRLDILSGVGVTPLAAIGPAGYLLVDNIGTGQNYYQANSFHVFATGANVERMRIDAAGTVLVGVPAAFSDGQLQVISGAPPLSLKNSNSPTVFWRVGPAPSDFAIVNQSSVGVILPNGGTAWVAGSDERLKTNLQPILNAVDKVATLRAVTGRYLRDAATQSRAFLIAQDVQSVLPEAVTTLRDPDTGEESLGLAYTDVIPLLVAAVKELNLRIAALGG